MLKIASSRLLSNQAIFLVVVCLFVAFILDTTFVRTYDIISKQSIPIQTKNIIFSLNISFCLIFQFLILRYTKNLTVKRQLRTKLSLKFFEVLGRFGYFFIVATVAFMIFQIFYFDYYSSFLLILIILVTYGIAAILVGKTTILFLSWYRQTHNILIFMYFFSMLLILFTLIVTNLIVNLYLNERPKEISEFAGGSMDITGGKYSYFTPVYKFSTIISFLSIWLTTSLLMYSSKDRMISRLRYWVIPIILLSYFLTSYLAQEIYRPILVPFLQFNPIMLTILLIMIFTLAKPVGGIMFGVAFWNISKKVSFEKSLRGYMIISGYGFLLLFCSNQASFLVLTPYPPFGVATVTILIVSSYLIMIGIYTSATLVSINNNVRNSIHQIAKESKLLDFIGKAEMEKEVTKIVNKVSKETEVEEDIAKTSFNLDEQGLKNYIVEVADELRKRKSS
jgi:hypothetical protein